jgi:hypothetical protein
LVGLAVGGIIALGMSTVYVFATRTGIENDSQAYLQRQAALINDEIAMRVRAAVPFTPPGGGASTPALAITTCSGVQNSLQVNYPNPIAAGNPGSLGAVGYHLLCYHRDTENGTRIIRDHCPPDGSGNPLPCAPTATSGTSFREPQPRLRHRATRRSAGLIAARRPGSVRARQARHQPSPTIFRMEPRRARTRPAFSAPTCTAAWRP